MAKLLMGKEVSARIKDELKIKVAELKEKGINPALAVIIVGEDPASKVYVNNKKKACEYCGYARWNMHFRRKQHRKSCLSL